MSDTNLQIERQFTSLADWIEEHRSDVRVECLQCGMSEYLSPSDVHHPYFCSERCQSDYHCQLDPNNYVRGEEG